MKICIFILCTLSATTALAKAKDICYYSNERYRHPSRISNCSRDINSSLISCCGLEKSAVVETTDNESACQRFIQSLQLNCQLTDKEFNDLNQISSGTSIAANTATKKANKDTNDLIADRVCFAMNNEIKNIEEGKRLTNISKPSNANLLAGFDGYRVAQACSYTLYGCVINDKGQSAALEDQPWAPGPTPDLISGPSQKYKSQWCYQVVHDKASKQDYLNNEQCLNRISQELRAFGKKTNSSGRANSENFAFHSCRPKDFQNKPINNVLSDFWSNGLDSLVGGQKE